MFGAYDPKRCCDDEKTKYKLSTLFLGSEDIDCRSAERKSITVFNYG